MMTSCVAVVVFFLVLITTQAQDEGHCNIDWTFPRECGQVASALAYGVGTWMRENECGSSPAGETCTFINNESDGRGATMTGLKVQFPGDQESDYLFRMIQQNGYCSVRGHGHTTYDLGLIYCIMQTMMNYSQLTSLYSFTQTTNLSMCPEWPNVYCDPDPVFDPSGIE